MKKESKKIPTKRTVLGLNKNEVWGLYIDTESNKKMSFEKFCTITKTK